MLATIFTSLVVALMGALGYLAYHHPYSYRKLHKFLIWIISIAMPLIFLWDMTITLATSQIYDYIQPEKFKEAREAAESLKVPQGWTLIVYLCLVLYLAVLYFLPDLLSEEQKTDELQEIKEELRQLRAQVSQGSNRIADNNTPAMKPDGESSS